MIISSLELTLFKTDTVHVPWTKTSPQHLLQQLHSNKKEIVWVLYTYLQIIACFIILQLLE